MAISYTDYYATNTYGSSAITGEVDVSEGDLIVVWAGANLDINITGITDDGGNDSQYSTNLRSQLDEGAACLRSSWAIASSNESPLTITIGDSGGTGRRFIGILVFTPDTGETVSLDASGTKVSGGAEASPWETSEDDTTGTDEVCIACFLNTATRTYSSHEIPSGVAADAVPHNDVYMCLFYSIKTSTVSGIEGEVNVDTAAPYMAEMLCFMSEEEESSSSSSESSSSSSSESSSSSSSESSSSSSESSSSSSSESSSSSSESSSSSSEGVGTVYYGHQSGTVGADYNFVKTFAGYWTGGTISGSGDDETLTLEVSESSESDTRQIGVGQATIVYDQYQSGSGPAPTIEYKQGATKEACEEDTWHSYSEAFACSGWIKVKFSR